MPGDETTHFIHTDSGRIEVDIPLQDWQLYRIESLLGEGGMARVYKAYDPKLSRYVALKFIRSEDEEYKKRLLREARAQAQIEHDNVCKIYEVGEVQGKPYIAMQLIPGQTLQELSGELSLEQKIRLMEQVCDAMQTAHRLGIVHRDIKPSNILIERRDDGSLRPYLVDFGIAREISEAGITATSAIMGTPAFMSPEQLLGNRMVDRRADIYSMGSTLYYLLSGQRPFDSTGVDLLINIVSEEPVSLNKIVPFIPEDLKTIVSKCLEKDPARRYDSARALGDDLKRYLEGEPILAHRPTLRYRVFKKIKRHKTVAVLAAAASIVIIALAGFSLSSYLRAAKEVKVAREFSRFVEEMDWKMRVAYMTPLHDIRKEKSQVLQRLKEIEVMTADVGKAGLGPGSFALGRGYLALQDYEKARMHLERAWNAGYQRKEVANALGLTLGALYEKKVSEVNRIKDKETRMRNLLAVKREFRDPAVRYLRQTPELGSQSREYGEALLAYYEENWDAALRLARQSSEKFPWLYEARMLQGQVFEKMGEQASHEGKFDLAKKHYQASAENYSRDEEICRSNAALYQNQCSLWRAVMAVQFATGKDGKSEYEQSNQYCKKAINVNPEDATSYELFARTAWRWGENELLLGHDPSDAFHTAIELSGKALTLDPENARASLTLGTAYSYLADYQSQTGKDPTKYLEQSIRALELSVKKDSSSPVAFAALGGSYFGQGIEAMTRGEESKSFFVHSIDAYKRALELSPRHFGALSNLAYVYTNLGLIARNSGNDPTAFFQQALENFEKALKINPNYWLIHTNIAAVYLELVSYELEHGKNPYPNIEKALSECQKGENLKPGNPHSSVNSASAHLYRAEYLLAQNDNPLPWIKETEEKLIPLIGLHYAEVFTGLADAKRIEAQHLIQKKESPVPALRKSMDYMKQALKLNPAQQQIHHGMARLEFIRAEWLLAKNRSPEEPLNLATEHARKTLDLNPKFAQAYAMLGEIQLKKSEWKIHLNQNPQSEIQEGLLKIQKCMELNPDIPGVYATKANLLLIQAQWSPDRESRMVMLAGSIENFERAFSMNPSLQNKEKENFQNAKMQQHKNSVS
ncbi:protein kinase [bacterium]|nr:protein kinase [bacterium]